VLANRGPQVVLKLWMCGSSTVSTILAYRSKMDMEHLGTVHSESRSVRGTIAVALW
jgi:hypothetical protein